MMDKIKIDFLQVARKLIEDKISDASIFKLIDGKLLHPLNDPVIEEELLGKVGSRSSLSELKSKDKTAYKDFEKTQIFITDETPKYDRDYLHLDHYLKPQIWKDFEIEVLNELNDYSNIGGYVTALIGNRGSGKSEFLRCWLKDSETEDRFTREHIFWVNCNSYTLYECWKKRVAEFSSLDYEMQHIFANKNIKEQTNILRMTVETYYYIILVALIYHIIENKKTTQQKIHRLFQKAENFSFKNEILSKCKDYSPDGDNERKISSLLKAVIGNQIYTKNKAALGYLELGKKIEDFLDSKGIKILRIIDGADNVELLSGVGKELYNVYLNQLREFLSHTKFGKNIVPMRGRTLIDINKLPQLTINQMPRNGINKKLSFNRLEIKTPPFNRVLLKKYSKSKNIMSQYFPSEIVESFNIGNSNYLGEFFNGNCRSFLYNIFSLTHLSYYYYLQSGKKNNLKNIIDQTKYKNLFLNGNLYLSSLNGSDSNPSEFIDIDDGVFAFNIFLYKNNPLLVLRIYQLMDFFRAERISATKENLVLYLSSIFNYPEENIQDAIELCRNFALINTKHNQNKTYFLLNNKFKYLIFDVIFSNLDVLYTLALDTHLPEKYFSENLINVRGNDISKTNSGNFIRVKTSYREYCIVTSLSFLAYLNCCHKIELSSEELQDQRYKNVFYLPSQMASSVEKLEARIRDLLFSTQNMELLRPIVKQLIIA